MALTGVPAAQEIMSRSVGHEDRSEFAVKKDGSIDVRGKDGQNCVLSVTLRVSALTAKRLERTTTKSGLLQKVIARLFRVEVLEIIRSLMFHITIGDGTRRKSIFRLAPRRLSSLMTAL